MSTSSTNCKKCFFAHKKIDDSSIDCDFYIPDAIRETIKIDLVEEYNYIHDYKCRYGIAIDQATKIIEEYKVDNLKQYVSEQAAIKYYLFIKVSNTTNITRVCENIKKLNIRPTAIGIALENNTDVKSFSLTCENLLGKSFSWKLHYFIEEKTDSEMLSVAISTDERLNNCTHVLLCNENTVDNIIKNDSINKINYITNVQQPKNIAILYPKNHTDYFYGLFTPLSNLKGIYTNFGSNNISYDIEQNCDPNNIEYYD